MIAAIHRMFGLGKVNLVDDSQGVQTAQVQMSAVESRDQSPIVQHFGFASNPPPGSDVFFISMSGDRTKVLGVGTNHPASRQTNTPTGGAKMYDAGGRYIGMLNDGNIVMMAPGETLRQLMTEVALQVFNAHTHPCPGGTTGVPNQQMGAADLTGATRAGGP